MNRCVLTLVIALSLAGLSMDSVENSSQTMRPAGSLHDQIARNWKYLRSYVIKDGHLFIEFEPLEGSSSSGSLFGKKWMLTEISGTAIKPGNAYIEFDSETKRYSGNGGCNRIAGGFTITGMNIKLSQGISTKRACIDKEIQKVETDFLGSLQAVTRFAVQDKTLRLFAGDRPVLIFTAN